MEKKVTKYHTMNKRIFAKSSPVILCLLALLLALVCNGASGRGAEGAPGETGKAPSPSVAAAPSSPEAGKEAGKETEKESPWEKLSVTRHTLKIGAEVLKYEATAGFLPIKEDAGKTKANIFFVAYVKERRSGERERPVAFAFNGGPGAASIWLHLGALGPRTVPVEADGKLLSSPSRLEDNPDTWLRFTDLVFIDPVGTGFSRAAQGEDQKQFFSPNGDVDSIREFIRLYCARFNRWQAPKFLIGESYGGARAAILAERLQETCHMLLNGVVLLSPALNFQTISFDGSNDLPCVLFLPSYTMTAWFHKKLPDEFQRDISGTLAQVEKWAFSEYLPALARGNTLSPEERAKVAETLARYTGLSTAFVESADLRIDQGRFSKELLRSEHKTVGRLDTRFEGTDANQLGEAPEYDPVLFTTAALYNAAMNGYLENELYFKSDLVYEPLNEAVSGGWDWGFGKNGRQGYVDVTGDLQRAMAKNPDLKVFAATGYYDLGTPYLSIKYALDHMAYNTSLASRITFRIYDSGHQLYTLPAASKKFSDDGAAFFKSALESVR